MPTGVYKRTELHKQHQREVMLAKYPILSPEEKKEKHRKKYLKYREYFIAKAKAWRTYGWNPERRARAIATQKRNRYETKLVVFDHYSKGTMKCVCCGEEGIVFLTIDHIEGDGAKWRKEHNVSGGARIHRWLVNNNFPEGFQVLCCNCNFAKRNTSICPHKLSQLP